MGVNWKFLFFENKSIGSWKSYYMPREYGLYIFSQTVTNPVALLVQSVFNLLLLILPVKIWVL